MLSVPGGNPANEYHRNLRIADASRRALPGFLWDKIVLENTDFEAAVRVFKMGFPLNMCMAGVRWPQVHTFYSGLSFSTWQLQELDKQMMRLGEVGARLESLRLI